MLFEFTNLTYEFDFGAVIQSLWKILFDRLGLEGLVSEVWFGRSGFIGLVFRLCLVGLVCFGRYGLVALIGLVR